MYVANWKQIEIVVQNTIMKFLRTDFIAITYAYVSEWERGREKELGERERMRERKHAHIQADK